MSEVLEIAKEAELIAIGQGSLVGQKFPFNVTLLSSAGRTYVFDEQAPCLLWLSMRSGKGVMFSKDLKRLHSYLRVNRYIQTLQTQLAKLHTRLVEMEDLTSDNRVWKTIKSHEKQVRFKLMKLATHPVVEPQYLKVKGDLHSLLVLAKDYESVNVLDGGFDRVEARKQLLIYTEEAQEVFRIQLSKMFELS